MKAIQELYNNPYFTVFVDCTEIIKKHKKKFIILLIFELWIHSLVFQHIAELKSLIDLLPFTK